LTRWGAAALAALAVVSAVSAAPARPVNLGVRVEIRFTDAKTARMILPSGRLASTLDKGRTWVPSSSLTMPLHDLAPVDRRRAYAVATDGRLFATRDGGRWLQLSPGLRFETVVAAGPRRLFALTPSHELLVSADAGATWGNSITRVTSICALDARTVLATRLGSILRSTDSGRSFRQVFQPPLVRDRGRVDLACGHGGAWATISWLGGAASQTAYVVLSSPDLGLTWTPRLAEQYFSYWSAVRSAADGPPMVPIVTPTGPATAVAAGGCTACGLGFTTVLITNDAGKSWNGAWSGAPSESSPPILDQANPLTIAFGDRSHGLLVVQDMRRTTSARLLGTADGGETWRFLGELPGPVHTA
jgi:photosystem II stability/assembly factor-like uncharacterized protein